MRGDTLEAGECVWKNFEIPEKSRFSSGKRLLQSRYSEGVIDIDTNRQTNKSKVPAGRMVSTFQ